MTEEIRTQSIKLGSDLFSNLRGRSGIARLGKAGLLLAFLSLSAVPTMGQGNATNVPTKAKVHEYNVQAQRFLQLKLNSVNAEIQSLVARANAIRRQIEAERSLYNSMLVNERKAAALTPPSKPKADSAQLEKQLAERLKAAEALLKEQQAKADDLKQKIDLELALEKHLKEVQAQLDAATKDLNSPEAKQKAQLLAKIAQATATETADEAEIQRLTQALEAARKKQDENKGNVVLPPPGANHASTIYIECKSDGVTVFRPNGSDLAEQFIAKGSIEKNSDLKSIADHLSSGTTESNHVINFLVRPGGVKTYDSVRGEVLKDGVKWASYPISSTGTVKVGHAGQGKTAKS